MVLEQLLVFLGDRGQSPAPRWARRVSPAHAPVGGVEHEVEQLSLAGHVGVERHRSDSERLGYAAHREGLQSLPVSQVGRRPYDGVDAQTLWRAVPPLRRTLTPKKGQGPGRGTAAASVRGPETIVSLSTV